MCWVLSRAGTISHFMLGVPAPGQGNPPTLFWSFCKVGTGYSLNELRVCVFDLFREILFILDWVLRRCFQELQTNLQPHWKRYDPASPPSCLLLAEPHKERPDVWIDPKKYARSDRDRTARRLRSPDP